MEEEEEEVEVRVSEACGQWKGLKIQLHNRCVQNRSSRIKEELFFCCANFGHYKVTTFQI